MHGLTSAELHFSRDPIRKVNLHLNDNDLAEAKTKARRIANEKTLKSRTKGKLRPSEPSQGDVVLITDHNSKHQARAPHIVTSALLQLQK